MHVIIRADMHAPMHTARQADQLTSRCDILDAAICATVQITVHARVHRAYMQFQV